MEQKNELLQCLTALPTDIRAIEAILQIRSYSKEEICDVAYEYAEECFNEELDFDGNPVGKDPEKYISTNMPEIFALLLKHGLDPNTVRDGCTICHCVKDIFNDYVAADTLRLLLEYGADPYLKCSEPDLFAQIDFDLWMMSIEECSRDMVDAMAHCWLVMVAYLDNVYNGHKVLSFLPSVTPKDLMNHRNYDYNYTYSHEYKSWIMQVFDKQSGRKVAQEKVLTEE